MAACRPFAQLACFIVMSSMLVTNLHARLFTLDTPGTSKACVLVDLDFTIQVQAFRGSRLIAVKNLTSDDKDITVVGLCDPPTTEEILLRFRENSFWYLAFREIERGDHAVGQNRGFQFRPVELFGKVLAGARQQIFYDKTTVYQDSMDTSYFCSKKNQALYVSTIPSKDFGFRVNVTVSRIQSQGYNIKGNQFGPKELC